MRLANGVCIAVLLTWQLVLSPASALAHSRVRLATRSASQQQLRVAIIGVSGKRTITEPGVVEIKLADSLIAGSRVSLIHQSILKPALAGIGYDGSINMSKDQARRLGAAIGCDFFIMGKSEALTRSARENESHEEAYAGVLIIDARTGALALFDFIAEKAASREAAVNGVIRTLSSRVSGYVDRITQIRDASRIQSSQDSARESTRSSLAEPIEEVPEEGSTRAVGFTPPEVLNRVKPEYTSEAEQADIAAVVEAMVVFRSNGEVGHIEITRWAGFGLDESSERAIRQLKFKPATRDGKPITVRALVRHNFRRLSEPNDHPEQQPSQPPAKPERDLRELFKPTYRRP